MNFTEYLKQKKLDASLGLVLQDICGICVKISEAMKKEVKGYSGTENVYGEKQLKMDVFANDQFVSTLLKNPAVNLLASEELENSLSSEVFHEGYSVAFDPLDGSSLADVNLSVGSIVSVYKGNHFIGRTGRDQVAALIFVYGPRLTCMVTVGQGVDEFTFDSSLEEFILTTSDLRVNPEATMFAPGNLRACSGESWYMKLLEYWIMHGYTLRYSGGMVPDVNQILKKRGGIFTYPGYKEQPQGKLRLLYECAPMAFLMEQAGGVALSNDEPILDIEINKLDQRTPIFLGSSKEIERVRDFFLDKK